MLANFKFLTLLLAVFLLLEQAMCSRCTKKNHKCKKKGNPFTNVSTSPALTKDTKQEGQSEVFVSFPTPNTTLMQEFDVPEKYRAASYEKVTVPRNDVADLAVGVMLDGVPWLWPSTKIHLLQNSTGFQQKAAEILSPNSSLTLPLELNEINPKTIRYIRIVTIDGYCVEQDNSVVIEKVCQQNSEKQKFFLKQTVFSDTYLISGQDDKCILQGGDYLPCSLRDGKQKFTRRSRKFFGKTEDMELRCPVSNGIGGKAVGMTECQPVPSYLYLEQSFSDETPKPKYVRLINDDGFCLELYANEFRSALCVSDEGVQNLRKLERPDGHFWLQNSFGICVRESDTGDYRVRVFEPTDNCPDGATGFSYELNKVVTTTSSCFTMMCLARDCNPQYKRIISRNCEEGRNDQKFHIRPFEKTDYAGYQKSWVAVTLNPGSLFNNRAIYRGFRYDDVGTGSSHGNMNHRDRWFQTSEIAHWGDVVHLSSLMSLEGTTGHVTTHLVVSKGGELSTKCGNYDWRMCPGVFKDVYEDKIKPEMVYKK